MTNADPPFEPFRESPDSPARPISRIELDGFGEAKPARRDRAKPDRTRRRPDKGRGKVAKDSGPVPAIDNAGDAAPAAPPPKEKARHRDREKPESGAPVIGLGDHVPAFLRRPPSGLVGGVER